MHPFFLFWGGTMKKASLKSASALVTEWLGLSVGSTLTAVGIYFFEFLNHFTTGGVSGASLLLSAVIPAISASSFMLFINFLLLLIGFLVIGVDFGIRTLYCGILISLETLLLEKLFPLTEPLTDEPMLELALAILLPSLGTAIILYCNGSTGGTDIVAIIIKKLTDLRISVGLLLSDFLIVSLSFPIFGVRIWLFSILGFLARLWVLNQFLREINASKYCTVICDERHVDTLCHFVTRELQKSATVGVGFVGAYRQEKKSVLLIALTGKQASRLKRYVQTVDDEIFMIVCKTDEISGYGFREPL